VMHRRTLSLSPLMLALALAPGVLQPNTLRAAEGVETASGRSVAADASLAEAQELYRDARFAEALAKTEEALRRNPELEGGRTLKSNILAVLGEREDRLKAVADWAKSLQDIHTQEVAVRIRGLIESGDKAYSRGDYANAELDFDRAEVSLRTFPYSFDWGQLPAQLSGKRAQAQAQARSQSVQRDADSRDAAVDRAREQALLQEDALAAKVDELLFRARDAYERKDFRRAELDAWNAYELDRRREDARKLYLESRREGHALFDIRQEDERLERVARVNEEIYRSMIPQSELLVYPEDWQRRNQRKPREIGSVKEEPWMAALRDSLDQRVTFDFQEQAFEDVVAFLRQLTGVNIVVAPTVQAKGGGNVTLNVKEMRFGDALKWVLELTSLKMAMQNQAIYISDEEITGAVTLRLYDVADLSQARQDFAGRELAFNASDSGGGIFTAPAEGNEPPSPDELADFVKRNVTPTKWEDEATGFGIQPRGGSTLFISATPEVHNQIDQLLTSLRNQDRLQVKVDVRILNVRKNFFEEIGVDWTDGNILPVSSGNGYARENPDNLIAGNVNTVKALPDNTVGFNQFGAAGARGLQAQGTLNAFNFLGQNQLSMVLTAVENESDMQQVAQPMMVCFNGQRANASFMTQYAYIKSYDVVSGNLDPKIEVLTFGDIIDIRPVVSSDRKYIMMEVKPSSVDLIGTFTETLIASRVIGNGNTVVVFAPIFSYPLELPNVEVKGLRSTIMLPDKGSLMLGGFQKSIRQRTHVGIPFLSHIPFLGRLFSRNGTYDDNRKIYYLLHSEILNLTEKEALQ